MSWIALIVTAGVAAYWFRQARIARDELANARWIIAEKLDKELKTRPPKVYMMPAKRAESAGGGDAA